MQMKNLTSGKKFFDSLHIQGRPTGLTIGNSFLLLPHRNGMNLFKCCARAYNSMSERRSKTLEAVSVIISNKEPATFS